MGKNKHANITQSYVEHIIYGSSEKIWDQNLKGFGVRVHKNGASYFINYRDSYGKQQYYTIGRTNEITLKNAKKEGASLLSEVRKGNNPLEERKTKHHLKTVSELCDLYLKEASRNKKASTILTDKSRIECHIKPLIGKEFVKSLTKAKIIKLMNDIADGKTAKDRQKTDKLRGTQKISGGTGAASRTIGMFGAILNFAVDMGIIDKNPCEGVKRPPDQVKDTYLTVEELGKLGYVMRHETNIPQTILNVLHLIMLTGCRKNEIQQLKWSEVDLENQCFRFEDTKTGKQMRPFGIKAKEFLKKIKPTTEKKWVFPSNVDSNIPITDVRPVLKRLIKKAGIKKDISVHTLRHTFATLCEAEDYLVAILLGHSNKTTTSLYRHNPNPSKAILSVADEISTKIENALNSKKV